jgi:protein SCO1
VRRSRALLRWGLAALLLGAAGGGAYRLGTQLAPPPAIAATALQNPQPVGAFPLVAPDGAAVTLAEVIGDAAVTLVFFGFTRCPDVCPITMARLGKMIADLGDPADVRVVMITVDPEHDTPEVIGRYARSFHPSFVGLTGSNSEVAQVTRAFFVGYADLGGGQFTHTEVVAVVDADGMLRAVYGSDRVLFIERDLPALRRLLRS